MFFQDIYHDIVLPQSLLWTLRKWNRERTHGQRQPCSDCIKGRRVEKDGIGGIDGDWKIKKKIKK